MTGIERTSVQTALGALGAAGRVGYDLAQSAYFHRELPYDRAALEKMHPRLLGARELVEQGAVRLDDDGGATVRSGDADYRRARRGRGRALHVRVVREARRRARTVQARARGRARTPRVSRDVSVFDRLTGGPDPVAGARRAGRAEGAGAAEAGEGRRGGVRATRVVREPRSGLEAVACCRGRLGRNRDGAQGRSRTTGESGRS